MKRNSRESRTWFLVQSGRQDCGGSNSREDKPAGSLQHGTGSTFSGRDGLEGLSRRDGVAGKIRGINSRMLFPTSLESTGQQRVSPWKDAQTIIFVH